jgi:uncharacterized membrane protein YgdD (TMEM256/DUF423 family)
MNWSRSIAICAASLGFSGVALAAAASHVLSVSLGPEDLRRVWIACAMLLAHAPTLLILSGALRDRPSLWLRLAAASCALGAILFSGSLVARALLGSTSTALAPTGGVLLMLAWICTGVGFARAR